MTDADKMPGEAPMKEMIVDVGRLIDERPLGRFQSFVMFLTAMAIIMDGFDNRLLSLAIPSLIKEWGVTRDAFAMPNSVGLIGMAIGTTLGGMIGDKIGRRPSIIYSVMIFGGVTFANAFVNDVNSMSLMRFVAGLGLGGLMPAAASMFAEFSPARRRTVAVTLGVICVPLGGTLSGLLAAEVLPVFGWRSLFMIGGGAAVAIGLVQLFALAESPRFLARDAKHRDRLAVVLARLGIQLRPQDVVAERADGAAPKASYAQLFAPGLLRDTLGLWAAFFAALLCVYMESFWMPTLLSELGYSLKVASTASSCLSFGGMFACLFGVIALERLGSRVTLMGMAACAVFVALGLTQFPMDPTKSAVPLLVILTVAGFLIGGLQNLLYSVGTHIYPTALRATGIGWAVGIGRFGSVISPFVATASLGFGGWRFFFVVLAIGMTATFLSLGIIRNHIPARRKKEAL